MYPAKFEYRAPGSLEEALSILADRGDEARILAGGQSLIPMMKLRFAAPGLLVDINRVPGQDFLEEFDGHLRIGPLVRHNQVADSPLVARHQRVMGAAAPWIADPLVRNLGTVAGSLAHADPLGDWASVMLACGAEVVARSSSAERAIPIEDFVLGPFTTALEPGEMIAEIRVPKLGSRAGGTYLKLERKIGDYATVGVAVRLELDQAGTISDAGIALTSVAPSNIRATSAEALLRGEQPSEELFGEAAEAAAQAAEPESDARGSAEYKRHVVGVFTRRGLAEALEQAGGA